ncbi:MAG: TRAP transporter large permease subunit [Spirochaetota bacterium]|nr:TRAP transporter large permease subunit [Spirochaetota bacterium]
MEYFLLIILLIIILFFLIGAPIFAVVGGVALLGFLHDGESLTIVAQDIYRLASAPGFIALPLFILAGYYIAESNFATRLLRFFEAIAGSIKGGTILAVLLSASIFTAFTGASAITVIVIGGITLPILKKLHYSDNFSLGLVAISGSSGILFPPCFAVILYGIIAKTSIQGIYVAGFIPILLVITSFFVYSMFKSNREDIQTKPFSMKECIKATYNIRWEMPLLIGIVISIFWGIITIEEAATITVIGFIIIEGCILREIKWGILPNIICESMMMLGAIFLIMGSALALSHYMVIHEIPQSIMDYSEVFITHKLPFLIFLNAFLLIVGMIMDLFSAILIVIPLIIPVAKLYGIDPLHLSVIFFINLELGYVTPPFGMSLFIASLRFKKPIIEILKGVLPFFLVGIICLIIITYWEGLSLWLVRFLNIQIFSL